MQIAEELLEENVHLTEWPTAVLGAFSPEYLALPRPCFGDGHAEASAVFPAGCRAGQEQLMSNFIAIRNGGDQYLDTVRTGFENVLAARFNDARFFHDLDRRTPLAAKD